MERFKWTFSDLRLALLKGGCENRGRDAEGRKWYDAAKARLTVIVLDDVMCFLEVEVIFFPIESRGTEGESKGVQSGCFLLLFSGNFLRKEGESPPWWRYLFKRILCPCPLCSNLPTHQNHLGEYLRDSGVQAMSQMKRISLWSWNSVTNKVSLV